MTHPELDALISGPLFATYSKGPGEPFDNETRLAQQAEAASRLEPERRRFQPHVTLARLDNPAEGKIVSYVQAHNLFRAEPMPVEHFTLFSSQLGKEASVYTPEVEYELA